MDPQKIVDIPEKMDEEELTLPLKEVGPEILYAVTNEMSNPVQITAMDELIIPSFSHPIEVPRVSAPVKLRLPFA